MPVDIITKLAERLYDKPETVELELSVEDAQQLYSCLSKVFSIIAPKFPASFNEWIQERPVFFMRKIKLYASPEVSPE